ncbi:MAG TPA: alpha/beta hydrolase [Jatrophihabitans sp.]|uniref:alpha/beta hydrolase n=1 Tax=Jatrophihabitans sp. TaxID=1932789 RepID=UPI002DFF51C2|nr:alpha/beta hydrolase [Jatrophihabitans sp.]
MPIPLKTRAFWAVYHRLEWAPVMQQPADKVRAASNLRRRMLRLPGMSPITGGRARGVAVEDSSFALVDGTVLPLRIYRPEAAPAAPRPVVVNFHGGGWVSGDPRQSEWWASSVAAQAGVVVVSVDYRLAPEHPFPTPAEDCYATTEWVVAHADEVGVDATRLAVMGDSAGGNLAAVVSLMARDRGGPAIALQVLIYPSTDISREYPSEHENATAPILQLADHRNVPGLYLSGERRDPADPYVSPLCAADHSGLPRALVQTAEFDLLRDQGIAYADALGAAGVEVEQTTYAGAVHGYISLPGVVPAAGPALAEAVRAIRSALRP